MSFSRYRPRRPRSCTESQNSESDEDSATECVQLNTLYNLHLLSMSDSNTQQNSKCKKKDKKTSGHGQANVQSSCVSRKNLPTSSFSNPSETETLVSSTQTSGATLSDATYVNVLPRASIPQMPPDMTNVTVHPARAPLRTTQVTHGNTRVTIYPTTSDPAMDFTHVTVQSTRGTANSVIETDEPVHFDTGIRHNAVERTDFNIVEADSSFQTSDQTCASVESTGSLNMDIQRIYKSFDRSLTEQQYEDLNKVVRRFIAKEERKERSKSIPRKDALSHQPSSTSFSTNQPSSTPAFSTIQPSSATTFATNQPSSRATFGTDQPSSRATFGTDQPSSAALGTSEPSSSFPPRHPAGVRSSLPDALSHQPSSTSFSTNQPFSTTSGTNQPSSRTAFSSIQPSSTTTFATNQPSSRATFGTNQPSSRVTFSTDQPSSSALGTSEPSSSFPPRHPAGVRSFLPPSCTMSGETVHLCYLTRNHLTQTRQRESQSSRETGVNTEDNVIFDQQPPESNAQRTNSPQDLHLPPDAFLWYMIENLGYGPLTPYDFMQIKQILIEELLYNRQEKGIERQNYASSQDRVQEIPSTATGFWPTGNERLNRDDHTVPKTFATFPAQERRFPSDTMVKTRAPSAPQGAEISAAMPTNATSVRQAQGEPGTSVLDVKGMTSSLSKLSIHSQQGTRKKGKENLNPNVLKKTSSGLSIHTATDSLDTAHLTQESRESIQRRVRRNPSGVSIATATDSLATAHLTEERSDENVQRQARRNPSGVSIATATDSLATAHLTEERSDENVQRQARRNPSGVSIATATDSLATAHLTEERSDENVQRQARRNPSGDCSNRRHQVEGDDNYEGDSDSDHDYDIYALHGVAEAVAEQARAGLTGLQIIADSISRYLNFRRQNIRDPNVTTRRTSRYNEERYTEQFHDYISTTMRALDAVAEQARAGLTGLQEIADIILRCLNFRRQNIRDPNVTTRRTSRYNEERYTEQFRDYISATKRALDAVAEQARAGLAGLQEISDNISRCSNFRGQNIRDPNVTTRRTSRCNEESYTEQFRDYIFATKRALDACSRQLEDTNTRIQEVIEDLWGPSVSRRQNRRDPRVTTRRTSRSVDRDNVVTEESRTRSTDRGEPVPWDDCVNPSELPMYASRGADINVPRAVSARRYGLQDSCPADLEAHRYGLFRPRTSRPPLRRVPVPGKNKKTYGYPIKKTDPVARIQEYRAFWGNYHFPGYEEKANFRRRASK